MPVRKIGIPGLNFETRGTHRFFPVLPTLRGGVGH